MLYAGGDQSTGDQARFSLEFEERPPQVAIGIDERLVGGNGSGQPGQQLADRYVTDRDRGQADDAGILSVNVETQCQFCCD
jgi:hypothetical protein